MQFLVAPFQSIVTQKWVRGISSPYVPLQASIARDMCMQENIYLVGFSVIALHSQIQKPYAPLMYLLCWALLGSYKHNTPILLRHVEKWKCYVQDF